MADIFGSEPIEPNDDDNASTVTIDTLVGEGQKYKTPSELAKAYHNADAYIARAKQEKLELEAELKVLRDLAEARNKNPEPKKEEPPAHEQRETESRKENVDISELVRQELSNASAEKTRADNINAAAEQMTKRFGSPAKANEAIRNKAQELGVSPEWLQDAAARSPTAFFATMGITPEARSSSTPSYSNDVRLPSSGAGGMKNFKYFEDLRKASPKTYHSAEVQKQLFAARRELGDKFYTT